jgi:hypothetical protein
MNLTQWETIAGIAESVATVIALLVAGVWTYRLFIKNRTSYPRVALEIKTRVQDISESCRIVRVEIHVANEGQVLLPVGDLECRLLQVLPVVGSLEGRLREGESLILENAQRVSWPMLDNRFWKYASGEAEIEPGEGQSFCCDFSIDHSVVLAEIYCHLSNPLKAAAMGWTATAVIELTGSDLGMAKPPTYEEKQLPRQPPPERVHTQVPKAPAPEPVKNPPKKN